MKQPVAPESHANPGRGKRQRLDLRLESLAYNKGTLIMLYPPQHLSDTCTPHAVPAP